MQRGLLYLLPEAGPQIEPKSPDRDDAFVHAVVGHGASPRPRFRRESHADEALLAGLHVDLLDVAVDVVDDVFAFLVNDAIHAEQSNLRLEVVLPLAQSVVVENLGLIAVAEDHRVLVVVRGVVNVGQEHEVVGVSGPEESLRLLGVSLRHGVIFVTFVRDAASPVNELVAAAGQHHLLLVIPRPSAQIHFLQK